VEVQVLSRAPSKKARMIPGFFRLLLPEKDEEPRE
jgi:hypothetical protein